MRNLMLALALTLPSGARAEGGGWLDSWDAAFAKARAEKKTVLVEFQAVWCYSCYYMQKVVASKGFKDTAKDLVLLQMDIDKPEGRERKEKLKVVGVPTFIVFDASGKELGRISSDRTEPEFLALLKGVLAGKPAGEDGKLAAARDALQAAKKSKSPTSAAEALTRLMELEDGCDLPGDLDEGLDAASNLPEGRRKELVSKALVRLEAHAERRVYGARKERCSDMRTAPYLLNALYKERGENDKAQAALERILALLQKDVDDLGVGADRNLDDNLRFFLESAGKDAELDKLYPKLIAAYPADYVYAARYAKNLHARKEDAKALEVIEKGFALSYGGNRISSAVLKARVLAGLGRKEEGRKLLEAEKKAAKGRFPKELEGLEKALQELK